MPTSTASKARSARSSQRQHGGHAPGGRVQGGRFDPALLTKSLPDALRKLDPRTLWRNPVMFIVEIGAVWSTVLTVRDSSWFGWLIVFWLWLTVLFGNIAEAVAEGRGKAQADALRKSKADTIARRLRGWSPETPGTEEDVRAPELQKGDIVVVEAGEIVPGDGDDRGRHCVGERIGHHRRIGAGDPGVRRRPLSGHRRHPVLSDRIVVKITQEPGKSFIDRMIALVEGANRQKTPNEIALNILLASLTIIFVLAVATLQPLAIFSKASNPVCANTSALTQNGVTGVVLVALLVCLIPTTIGALLSAIGIAGMDRLVQRNVLAMSGRAVEAAGDVNTLLLDKTGTITIGNREASEFIPVTGVTSEELADAAQLSSLADETPEGRSIVVYAKQAYGLRERSPGELSHAPGSSSPRQTRMSGVDLDGATAAQGRGQLGRQVDPRQGGTIPDCSARSSTASPQPAEPRWSSEWSPNGGGKPDVLGVIHLKDIVKQGMRERFDEMRAMGIRTVMITGDNPLTAKAIADEAGVDDFLAEATPEDKMALIKREQPAASSSR
jgi:K+-transporting ATPase ATPase B chain